MGYNHYIIIYSVQDTLYYRGREGDSLKRRISRKLVWDDRGVSEVVGTILMLAITVVLFSSITMWVSSMPEPQGRIYLDIEGRIVPEDINDITQGAEIRLLHVGGVDLDNFWTTLVVKIDGTRTILDMEDSTTPLGDFWEATETWTYDIAAGVLTNNSDVSVSIVDRDVDTQVWEGSLMGENTWFEPIIMNVWIDSDLVSEFPDPGPILYSPTEFMIFAQIIDPEGDHPDHGLNITNVWVNMTPIGRGYVQLTDGDSDNVFTGTIQGPTGDFGIGYYEFVVNATDYDGKYVEQTFKFSVGGDVGQNPQIIVGKNNITSGEKYIWTVPENPLHGDTVQLYAKIRNRGGAGAMVDINFWDNTTGTNISTVQALINFGDYIVSTPWLASPGGLHNITVNATVNETWSIKNGISELIVIDNQNSTEVIVLPTILLVDDDAHMNDGSLADTSAFMRASLEASDFNYDFTVVSTGGDGPAYNEGDYRLEEYDIVIWMTGYEKSYTLKVSDMENIWAFLNNSGSLWVIGEGIFEDPVVTDLFLSDLHATRKTGPNPNPVDVYDLKDRDIWGMAGHNVTDYFSVKNITLRERIDGFSDGYDLGWGSGEFALLNNDTAADIILATNYSDDAGLGMRIFTQSFEFSMIETTADMAQLSYKVITWLGRIDMKFGRDLAVSEQFISPSTVFYQQPVTITGVIRNNGFAIEPSVNWSLTITEPDGTEWNFKSTDPTDEDGNVSLGIGQDNSYTIIREWTPRLVGIHTIVFEVDPDNQIIETNEDNNVLSDLLESGEINVQYIVLVVNDESIGGINETGNITSALDSLNYDYDLINGTEANDTTLTKYNAIIWVGGDTFDPLSTEQQENITLYLNANGRFWLTGRDCVGDDIDTDLEIDYFQLNTITTNVAMPSTLQGLDTNPLAPNPITHGMKYESNGTHDCDSITGSSADNVTGILYQDKTAGINGTFNGISYDSGTYRTVVTTFAINSLNSTDDREELVFMILHWFDKPDERTELRITDSDIKIRDSVGIMTHPQIGDAYILQATVHNPGGADANFLVRFMDGTTQIGADSVSISANGRTTSEIVWIPLFAGQRNINVFIDPLNEADEIFETSNNLATKPIYVYFFWDDMENGTYRWQHSSTVMLINGETPLDYFSETALYTDIATEWNETVNVSECTDPGFFNSYDKSFWMQEPPGNLTAQSVTRAVMEPEINAILNETRYMDDDNVVVNGADANDLTLTQTAGSEFTESPLVGTGTTIYTGMMVYIRNPQGVKTLISGGVVGTVARAWANNAGGLQSTTWTPPSTAMVANESIEIEIYQSMNVDPPVDFATNFTTEQLGANNLENVSWTIYYYTHGAKSGGSERGRFYYGDATYNSRIENFQYNLANLPPTIGTPSPANVTVGNPTNVNLTWMSGDADNDTVYFDVYLGYLGDDIGDMTLIANDITNNYFEVTGLDEDVIYSWIVECDDTFNPVVSSPTWVFATAGIESGGSGAFWGLTPNGTANINKTAITESVDLSNTESSTLSFWHKYNMISGVNGGVLMVGYKESAGSDFKYKYVIPSNAYTGSLLTNDTARQDDFGTWMRWAWNGVSTRGTFGWEKVTLDVLPYVPNTTNATYNYRSDVRIQFAYYQYGSGSGYGWYIDDVRIEASRSDYVAPNSNVADVWNLTDEDSHSGDWSWSNYDPDDQDGMKPGIDNSLMTNPIDLTNARWAEFSAYFKFNINTENGAPPDGFRIEVTSDNGVTWKDMTLGVRSAWGVSGTGTDLDDNNSDDKSYTGIPDSGEGNAVVDGYWVEAGTLTRLNIDLTPYSGKAIQIRFRVVTTLTVPATAYDHYADDTVGFGGFWVDDVIVRGETTNVYG